MFLYVGHRSYCVRKFLFISFVCNTEAGWKQCAKPDIGAAVEQLSDLGKCGFGFGNSCSVVWKDGNGLCVVSEWGVGGSPGQHSPGNREIWAKLVVVSRRVFLVPGFGMSSQLAHLYQTVAHHVAALRPMLWRSIQSF